MRYDLRFRNIRVGKVTENDRDFPNLWGNMGFDAAISNPTSEEEARLARFIELNRESIRLADTEDQQDVTGELNVVDKQLEAFSGYIESDDWMLVDGNGKTLTILVPIFRHDGEIVWRWNPDK